MHQIVVSKNGQPIPPAIAQIHSYSSSSWRQKHRFCNHHYHYPKSHLLKENVEEYVPVTIILFLESIIKILFFHHRFHRSFLHFANF